MEWEDEAYVLAARAHGETGAIVDLLTETHGRFAAHIAGEFEDGALMTAFGREGRGAFAAPSVLQADIARELGVTLLGHCADMHQEFYAISVERRITHPGVARITRVAKDLLGD